MNLRCFGLSGSFNLRMLVIVSSKMKFLTGVVLFVGGVAVSGKGQNPETINLSGLQKVIHSAANKIQVVNFWATWCAPCVTELPILEKVNNDRQDVQVTLVSMDLDLDPNPEKVYRFVSRKKIASKVLLLKEPDPNSWIAQVDTNWTGSLPATLIINNVNGKRKFIEGALHEGELEKSIDEIK